LNVRQSIEIIERLSLPFAIRDIEWVPNYTYGDDIYDEKVIAVSPYIRRESVITRLNVVCGPGNWENVMSPHGSLGLFQGIKIKIEDEWVIKYDGAAMETRDGIDQIKAVFSRSLRRSAEIWGVGLYLQFIPQLYAIKRPLNYYKAAYVWEKKPLRIRWDPPELPQEFLPRYMTPEQFIRMQRIRVYFSEEKQKKLTDIIEEWKLNYKQVSYEDANKAIASVENKINERLRLINKKLVIVPDETNQQKPVNKKESAGENSKKQKNSSENKKEDPNAFLNNDQWQALNKLLEFIKQFNNVPAKAQDPEITKTCMEVEEALLKHVRKEEPITVGQAKRYQMRMRKIYDKYKSKNKNPY